MGLFSSIGNFLAPAAGAVGTALGGPVGGALAGGIAGGLFGNSGGSSGEQQSGPPDYVNNALSQYSTNLQNFQYRPENFKGRTFANPSPFTKMATRRMGNFSNQPSQDYWSSVMNGDYLGMNPAYQQAVMDPAIQNTNAAFNQAGRFGSQANMQNTAQAGMAALAPYYNAERERMGQAAQYLPQLQAGEIAQQLQGGQMRDQNRQNKINQQMQRFQFGQNRDLLELQTQAGLLGPLSGVSQSTMQGPQSGWFPNALGGAMLGSSLMNNWNSTGGGGMQQPSFMQTTDQWGQGTWGDPFLSPRKL